MTAGTTRRDGIIWLSSGVETRALQSGDELSGNRCTPSKAAGEASHTRAQQKMKKQKGEGEKKHKRKQQQPEVTQNHKTNLLISGWTLKP